MVSHRWESCQIKLHTGRVVWRWVYSSQQSVRRRVLLTSVTAKHSAIIFENTWQTEVPEGGKATTVPMFSKGKNFSGKEKNRTKHQFIHLWSPGRTRGPEQPAWLEGDGFGARTNSASSKSDRLGKQLHSDEWLYLGFLVVWLQVDKSNASWKNGAWPEKILQISPASGGEAHTTLWTGPTHMSHNFSWS